MLQQLADRRRREKALVLAEDGEIRKVKELLLVPGKAPECADVLILAQACFAGFVPEEARKLLEAGLNAFPDSEEIRAFLGLAWHLEGQPDMGNQVLEKLLPRTNRAGDMARKLTGTRTREEYRWISRQL